MRNCKTFPIRNHRRCSAKLRSDMACGLGAGWCNKAHLPFLRTRKCPGGKSGRRSAHRVREIHNARCRIGLSFRQFQRTAFGQFLNVTIVGWCDVFFQRAGRKRLLHLGANHRQHQPTVALIFVGKNLPGFCVGNSDSFVGIHRQCFHSGNLPLHAERSRTMKSKNYPNLYLRIFVSTSCAHASMPPPRQRTFCKPCPMKYAAASRPFLPA